MNRVKKEVVCTPLKPICEKKDIRKNGTSFIYIQYCYSREHRTNLNTEIAISLQYWNKKKLSVWDILPQAWGDAEYRNTEIKRLIRLVEYLIELSAKKNISNRVHFVKEVFTPSLNLNNPEKRLTVILTFTTIAATLTLNSGGILVVNLPNTLTPCAI